MAQNQAPDDPEAEARLRKEAENEGKTIKRICDELDVRMHEVFLMSI
jgi:OTU domain-containing protein 6